MVKKILYRYTPSGTVALMVLGHKGYGSAASLHHVTSFQNTPIHSEWLLFYVKQTYFSATNVYHGENMQVTFND